VKKFPIGSPLYQLASAVTMVVTFQKKGGKKSEMNLFLELGFSNVITRISVLLRPCGVKIS